MLTMRNREWWALLFAADDGGGSGDDSDDTGDATSEEPKESAPSDPEPKGKQSVDPALALARAAVKKAEREAAAAKKRADDLEAATLSDKERAERERDEAVQSATAATDKLRKANLLSALVEQGLPRPKAALRLLDGVEYDDDDEPINVDDAIKAATAEFGDDLFRTTRRGPADINSGGGNDGQGQGPKLTSAELQMAGSLGQTPEQYAYYRDNPNAQQPYQPQVAAGSR